MITALWLCEEGKSLHRIRDIILGIRWLNEGILGTPAQGVHDLLPIHFERAAKTIAEAVRDKTVAYETARELALIADKIDDLGLSNSRIRFTNSLNEPLPRRPDRTTNDLERDALYHCINSPLDDGERVLMEALRLHFAWGGRIEETYCGLLRPCTIKIAAMPSLNYQEKLASLAKTMECDTSRKKDSMKAFRSSRSTLRPAP